MSAAIGPVGEQLVERLVELNTDAIDGFPSTTAEREAIAAKVAERLGGFKATEREA